MIWLIMSVCLFGYTNQQLLSDHNEIWYTGRLTKAELNIFFNLFTIVYFMRVLVYFAVYFIATHGDITFIAISHTLPIVSEHG